MCGPYRAERIVYQKCGATTRLLICAFHPSAIPIISWNIRDNMNPPAKQVQISAIFVAESLKKIAVCCVCQLEREKEKEKISSCSLVHICKKKQSTSNLKFPSISAVRPLVSTYRAFLSRSRSLKDHGGDPTQPCALLGGPCNGGTMYKIAARHPTKLLTEPPRQTAEEGTGLAGASGSSR